MGCPSDLGLELDNWGERLQTKLAGKRFPLSAHIELTERCNLRCVHCYINQPATDPVKKQVELSTYQWKSIINELVQAGTLNVCFTGGEIFLRDDFEDIYLHAIQSGLLVTLFTNGTLLTPRIADMLAEYRPSLVDITLYGATKETYEKVTGVKGAFDACMRGIALLEDRGIKYALKTIVLTLNQHEFSLIQGIAIDKDVKFRYDGFLWPRLDGNLNPRKYQISIPDLLQLDLGNPEREAEWKGIAERSRGSAIRADYVYSCGAGVQSYVITSVGEVKGCVMVSNPRFSLMEMTFAKAWEELGQTRKKKRVVENACRTCDLGSLCSQCPALSQAVNGDDESLDEFTCKFSRLRAAQYNV